MPEPLGTIEQKTESEQQLAPFVSEIASPQVAVKAIAESVSSKKDRISQLPIADNDDLVPFSKIEQWVYSGNNELQFQAMNALTRHGLKGAALLKYLLHADTSDMVKRQALLGLQQLSITFGAPALIANHSDEPVGRYAETLSSRLPAWIRQEPGLAAVILQLDSASAETRQLAIDEVMLGEEPIEKPLLHWILTSSEDEALQLYTARQLLRYRSDATDVWVPVLLGSASEQVQQEALITLVQQPILTDNYIPTLGQLARTTNSDEVYALTRQLLATSYHPAAPLMLALASKNPPTDL